MSYSVFVLIPAECCCLCCITFKESLSLQNRTTGNTKLKGCMCFKATSVTPLISPIELLWEDESPSTALVGFYSVAVLAAGTKGHKLPVILSSSLQRSGDSEGHSH